MRSVETPLDCSVGSCQDKEVSLLMKSDIITDLEGLRLGFKLHR